MLVAALVLPGLLYTTYAWANPLRTPAVVEHELQFTDRSAVQSPRLHHDAHGNPVAVVGTTMIACPDPECAGLPVPAAEPEGRRSESRRAAGTGMARLPDGRLAVATWAPEQLDGAHEYQLRLYGCDPEGCRTGAAQVLRTASAQVDLGWGFAAAVAVAPGGEIVVAHVSLQRTISEPATLSVTRCADLRCSSPRTVDLAELPSVRVHFAARPLAVAAGPGGTATVGLISSTGSVLMTMCDAPDCPAPTVTELVEPVATAGFLREDNSPWLGLELVLPAAGGPVIAYRHEPTGAARLLLCRDVACRAAEDVALTEDGRGRPAPALALDRAGRPMVATYDLADGRLILITCLDQRCTDRSLVPVANLVHGPGQVALGLTPDGRPQVVRVDTSANEYLRGPSSIRLTTCTAPDCR